MIIEDLLPDSSRKTADLASQFIIEHPDFIRLFISALMNKHDLSMRISRVLAVCNDKKPQFINSYKNEIFKILLTTDNHAVIRNLLYIFQTLWKKLNDDQLGKLLDRCFKYLEYTTAETSHRVYAMKIIYELTYVYPELRNDLKNIIEFHYDKGSAGFKACGKNILKKINYLIIPS